MREKEKRKITHDPSRRKSSKPLPKLEQEAKGRALGRRKHLIEREVIVFREESSRSKLRKKTSLT